MYFTASEVAAAVISTPLPIALWVTMDFFEHRYYRLNKIFLVLSGAWPYQSTRTRCGILLFFAFICVSQIVPQALALVKYQDEQAIVVHCITTLLFEVIWVARGLNSVWNLPKLSTLLDCIRMDWHAWAYEKEVNILHEYAEKGQKMSLAFTVEMYSVALVFVAQPTIPKIIDVWFKNGTAPGEFPSPVDYYNIDMQKYYFYIILDISLCHCVGVLFFMASEIMLFVSVQHVCGVFSALGCKLQRIGSNNSSAQSGQLSHGLNKEDIVDLASCIDRHNDAIYCANLIEATYTLTIFFVITIGMTALILVGLQILLGQSNPEATVRFVGVALASILHLYIECYISQMLTDHSISIHLYIHDSQWYNLAPKDQKYLQLMIMRCKVPCKLTAGNFLILSLRNFTQVMRTMMSYFTFMRSTQI